MPLFQLLLHCLSPSQHRLKAFRDRNLVFFSLFLSGTGQQHSLWLYRVGHTVCPLLAGLPSLSCCPGLPRSPLQVDFWCTLSLAERAGTWVKGQRAPALTEDALHAHCSSARVPSCSASSLLASTPNTAQSQGSPVPSVSTPSTASFYPSAGSFCPLPPAPRPEVPAPGPPFPSSPGPVKLSHKTCKPSPINLPIHSADISCAGAFSSICWFEVGFLFVLGAPLLSALAVSPAL